MGFKVALRTLYRNKLFASINVLGLSIGMSVTIVAFLIVMHDFSFDRHHKDEDRIYRIVSQVGAEPNILYMSGVPMPLGEAVRSQVTGVENSIAFFTINDPSITIPSAGKANIYKNQKGVVYASDEYFMLFNYKWLAGSPAISLNQPYQVVLTKSSAAQYYPGINANELIGQKLILNDSILTTVSGIVEDPSNNTDLDFHAFVSLATFQTPRLRHRLYDNWSITIPSSQLFVKLSKNYSVRLIKKQLDDIYRVHNPQSKTSVQRPPPYQLQPISNIHFDGRYRSYFGKRTANKTTLYGLILGAIFLLLLGCINFINLSTAQAADRAKEIAIRKTLGCSRKLLMLQYLRETFLMALLGAIVALCLVPITLHILPDVIPSEVVFKPFSNPSILLFALTIVFLKTLLAGIYPSWVLTRFSAVNMFKGKPQNHTNASRLLIRKGFILVQFIIAQVFIIGVVFVGLQLRYTLNKDLGFRKEAVIYFETNNKDTTLEKRDMLYNKLKSIPGISAISLSNGPAASDGVWSGLVKYSDNHGVIETTVEQKFADTNFLSLFNISIIAGRTINNYTPYKECVINKTYANVLGYKEPSQVIGKMLKYNEKTIMVVGVMADFYQESLYEPIKPLMVAYDPDNQRTFNVALGKNRDKNNTVQWTGSIVKIQHYFKEVYPSEDFAYEFQDETVERYYKADIKLSLLLKYITGLTVFISCMGLLGFILYSTNKRMKEISVRKVLGATVAQIVKLFTFEFMSIILTAFIIAVPITYWFVHSWLNSFAYRIAMSWWIFGVAGLIAASLAFIVIAFQTIRAAVVNPAEFLKMD